MFEFPAVAADFYKGVMFEFPAVAADFYKRLK